MPPPSPGTMTCPWDASIAAPMPPQQLRSSRPTRRPVVWISSLFHSQRKHSSIRTAAADGLQTRRQHSGVYSCAGLHVQAVAEDEDDASVVLIRLWCVCSSMVLLVKHYTVGPAAINLEQYCSWHCCHLFAMGT